MKMRFGGLILFICLLNACSVNHSAFTFKYDPAKGKLSRNPLSAIDVKKGNVLRLTLNTVRLGSLPEKHNTEKGEGGKREILVYAKIFKNGQFIKYVTITDIAEHMYPYQPVVVNVPIFFTETIDGYYQIILKAYEVDSKYAVRLLRQIHNTKLDVLESSAFAPGDAFTAGLQQVIYGLFDVITSLTGRTVDGWVAQTGATKVFEHSIYVSPSQNNQDGNYLIIDSGSGQDQLFVKKGGNETEISSHVNSSLNKLESYTLSNDALTKGTDTNLSGAAYMMLYAEVL